MTYNVRKKKGEAKWLNQQLAISAYEWIAI